MKTAIRTLLTLSLFFGLALSVHSAVFSKTDLIFTDVKEGDFADYNIKLLKSWDIVDGYEDGSFKPNKKINRAEFLKIILKSASLQGLIDVSIEGSNCFPDVQDQWFAPYVCTAKSLNIINGYPDGNFHPEQTINFVEAGKIIVNTFELQINTEKYQENWYQPYVFALAGRKAIPYTILGFEYPITRADMACMVTSALRFGSANCDSGLSYGELVGVSFIEDPMRLKPKGYADILFYKSHYKLYVVDYDGAVYEVTAADPDTFKNLAGSLYMDDQYIFKIEAPFSSSIEVSYLTEFEFDLPSLERLDEGEEHNWFFLKDKNNLYTSCGYSEIGAYQKIDNFDVENFKILVNHPNYAYFTDGENTYKATHEKPDSGKYYCEVKIMDDGFQELEWIYPKSVQVDYQTGNNIAFLKDDDHVYDPEDLSIIDWGNPESFELFSIQYGDLMDKNMYYVNSGGKLWLLNPYTFEFIENKYIDANTLDFVSLDYFTYYFDTREVSRDFRLSPGKCELMKNFFGDDTEIQYDNRTDVLEASDPQECILHSKENFYDSQSYYTFLMKDKNNFWLFNPINEEFEKVGLTDNVDSDDIRRWEYDEEGFKNLVIF